MTLFFQQILKLR